MPTFVSAESFREGLDQRNLKVGQCLHPLYVTLFATPTNTCIATFQVNFGEPRRSGAHNTATGGHKI